MQNRGGDAALARRGSNYADRLTAGVRDGRPGHRCFGWKAALTAVSPVSQDTVAGGNGFIGRRVSWLGSEGGRGVKVTIGVKP